MTIFGQTFSHADTARYTLQHSCTALWHIHVYMYKYWMLLTTRCPLKSNYDQYSTRRKCLDMRLLTSRQAIHLIQTDVTASKQDVRIFK